MYISRIITILVLGLALAGCNSGSEEDSRNTGDAESTGSAGAASAGAGSAGTGGTSLDDDASAEVSAVTATPVQELLPPAAVLASYDDLLAFIASQDDLNRGNRNALSSKISNSRRKYGDGRYCPARNMINAFLNQAGAFRNNRYPEIGNDLYHRGQLLLTDVLASLAPDDECSDRGGIGEPPMVEVLQSDNLKLAGMVRFGTPLQASVRAGGEAWIETLYPGLEPGIGMSDGTNIGAPGIPVLYRLIAVPRGATPVLTFEVGSQEIHEGYNAWPLQPTPIDAVYDPDLEELPDPKFGNPPFVKDDAAYEVDALYPPDPIKVEAIGQMRDLNLYQVAITPMQYNPVTDTAVMNNDISFEVTFDGGDGAFVSEQALNPFEASNQKALVTSNVLNGVTAYEYPYLPGITLPVLGHELIIITHPDFLDAANDLATWKRDKGISTRVVNNGAVADGGIGTSRDDIKDWLQDVYDTSIIRPSYVLLLGDAEFIGPFYRQSSGSNNTGTDLDYSLLAGNDLLADIGVARIPVDTADQAQTVVDKIINYESSPPLFATGFYNTASIPAYFQCCRTDVNQDGTTSRGYIETMEQIRNAIVGQGKTVERVYFSDTTYHGTYNGDTTPRRYFDGSLLPAAIGANSGFDWDADQDDVIDSINEGRFLVIHRDHGGENGWVFPPLASWAVSDLDNGDLLPVLFSVDCSTGFFDNETAGGDQGTTVNGVYLLERMLREADGGVVGALGDTRDSPTWANNALTRGFADAIFPTVMGGYGNNTSIRRLADILNYGKLYMFTQVGVAQTAGSVTQNNADSNNIMWHAYGDPTQEIWTSQPFILPLGFIQYEIPNGLEIEYLQEGAIITALQNGDPVGRAAVVNGMAVIKYVHVPDPGVPVMLSAAAEGAISVLLTPPADDKPDLQVDIAPPGFAIPGQSLTGLLGVQVTNSGDADAPGTVDANGQTTGVGYVIDIVLSTDTSVPEGFATPSDTFLEDALLVGGRVSRTPAVAAGEMKVLSTDPPVNSDIGGIIPADTPSGSYYLCARIDPGSNVDESDESNNVDCEPVVITFPPS